ncbi:non-ribosomal peptide synthetase [Kitasatospora sp. GAS1066B]|uniref:non-ribosomal peptide synthetase n=1 Tax=Kitasatospora sp. GAS1066B TaxID=3156271 RepID=UPI003511884E
MTERQNDDSQVGEGPAGPHRGAQAHGPRSVYFQRPVAPTERLYLAAGRLGPPLVLQLLVEGEGIPDPRLLCEAVAAAADACPGTRLVTDGRTWYDSGRPPRVRIMPTASSTDILHAHAAVLQDGLDPRTGPSCEVVLLPGPGERCTLAFRALHAVMDGHGALTWTGAVFQALRGQPPSPAHGTHTDHTLLAELGRTGQRPTLLLDQPSPLAAGPDTARRGAPRAALWRRHTLTGHHLASTARLARAVADATGAPSARVMVPVDLRRHRRELSSTANLSLPVFLDLARGAHWQDTQGQLLRALAGKQELAEGFETPLAKLPLPASALLLAGARAAAERRERHLASAVVSHLGRIDPARYTGAGFRATSVYALPVHAPLVPVSCVIVETPTGTELTVGIQGRAPLAGRAERLLDALLAAFPAASACSRPPTPDMAPPATAATLCQPPVPITAKGPPPRHTTVVRLLREQAARTPHASALDGPEGVVTYTELNRRSDAVARKLLRTGVQPQDLVGLVVERTPDGIAALWGILKAGAAYVPLDPRHPTARIHQILHDSGARLCLTQRQLIAPLTPGTPCPLLAVEDTPHAQTELELPDPDPAHLAYVIHTSGSTGTPKGVQIEHHSLASFLSWAAELCRATKDTRFASLSSLSFDISCIALFVPMLAGATSLLMPGEPTRAALHDLLHRHRADTLAITPTHLELIERLDLEPRHLRALLVGGEQFTRTAAQRARHRFGPHCRIINGYGPTEATVGCMAHVVDGSERGAAIPIGRPSPHVRIELMDRQGRPVAERPGAMGELWISGPQLARGYLHRPDLDTEHFPQDAAGRRSYRTGDLARRLPSGELEFVGRIDDQVKIAGHRIEPAEVVTALERHPGVLRAAVTVRSHPRTGAPALCAYVVPTAGNPSGDLGATLRAHLARHLPPYLVPTAVLPVDDLPNTIAGKTDLHALPDPFVLPAPSHPLEDEPSPQNPNGPAPQSPPVIDEVARIWAQILDIDHRTLYPHSHFQELGGDSLAVLEMLSAIGTRLLQPRQEQHFTSRLPEILPDLTLKKVSAEVQLARQEGELHE